MAWLNILGLLVLGYAAIAIAIYFNQNRLLYHPSTHDVQALLDGCQSRHLTPWPTADAHYLGLVSPETAPVTRGTAIVFHGNAGTALGRDYYIEALAPLGLRVILVEYPAYGAKGGHLGERSLVAAGQQAVERAQQDFGDPIYVIGESMGCGVACAVTAKTAHMVKGLLLITPWDSLPNLGQQIYWAFPTRWLVRDRYDNMTNCRDLPFPIGIVMALQDEIIPNERTLNLVQTLGDACRQWDLDAGHNNWFNQTNDAWWQEVMGYVTGTSPDAPTPANPPL